MDRCGSFEIHLGDENQLELDLQQMLYTVLGGRNEETRTSKIVAACCQSSRHDVTLLMSNRYKTILKALSERTGTPLPSLLLSFGVLHEITALVPLVGFFYGARTLGIGEVVIDTILQSNPSLPGDHQVDWYRGTLRKWVEEGDKWACRVGQRYGVFGFEKRSSSSDSARDVAERIPASSRIAGDIANAVVAYGLTKVNT